MTNLCESRCANGHKWNRKEKRCVEPTKPKCHSDEKWSKKVKRCVPLGKGHFCRSSGNPQFGTFSGVNYDLHKVGDFVLVQGKKFRIDVRQKRWNKAAVTERFAALVNRHKDRVEVLTEEKMVVNGKSISLNVGQIYKLAHGGSIHRYETKRVKVTGEDGSYVDAHFNHGRGWPAPQYINIIAFVPKTKGLEGLCVSKHQIHKAVGIFSHEYNPRFPAVKKNKISPKQRAKAKARCIARKVPKRHLRMCIVDLIQSGFSIHTHRHHRRHHHRRHHRKHREEERRHREERKRHREEEERKEKK